MDPSDRPGPIPDVSRVPPSSVTGLVPSAVLAYAAILPPATDVPPLKVLAAESDRTPEPSFVSCPVPLTTLLVNTLKPLVSIGAVPARATGAEIDEMAVN